jgi:hypothetical protein
MASLTAKEQEGLKIWNGLPLNKRLEAIKQYNELKKLHGDGPELMGFLPFLALLVPIAKKAFAIGKTIVSAIKNKGGGNAPPPPPPTLKIPPIALIGGGVLLLILLTRR